MLEDEADRRPLINMQSEAKLGFITSACFLFTSFSGFRRLRQNAAGVCTQFPVHPLSEWKTFQGDHVIPTRSSHLT